MELKVIGVTIWICNTRSYDPLEDA